MSMAKSMKVKQIPFPKELIDQVEERRKKMGIGFPEYIRHLVLNDIEKNSQEYVSKVEEEELAISLKDYSKGKYTVLKNKEDIDKYFNTTDEE